MSMPCRWVSITHLFIYIIHDLPISHTRKHFMVTCSIAIQLASIVVLHSPIEFLWMLLFSISIAQWQAWMEH